MWTGEGWKQTRRGLGVSAFVAAFALEAGLHVGLPIGIYGIIAGLLGLDVLADALGNLGVRSRR